MKPITGLVIVLLALLAALFILTGDRFGEVMIVIFAFSVMGLLVVVCGILVLRVLDEVDIK